MSFLTSPPSPQAFSAQRSLGSIMRSEALRGRQNKLWYCRNPPQITNQSFLFHCILTADFHFPAGYGTSKTGRIAEETSRGSGTKKEEKTQD